MRVPKPRLNATLSPSLHGGIEHGLRVGEAEVADVHLVVAAAEVVDEISALAQRELEDVGLRAAGQAVEAGCRR